MSLRTRLYTFRNRPTLSLFFALTVLVPAAHADVLSFSYSGAGVHSFSFTLPSAPTSSNAGATDFLVVQNATIDNVAYTNVNLNFFTASQMGGLEISHGMTILDFYGPALFAGTLSSPDFITGPVRLSEPVGHSILSGLLTVSNLTVAAPEPSTWAMLSVGILGLVWIYRRRMNGVSEAELTKLS